MTAFILNMTATVLDVSGLVTNITGRALTITGLFRIPARFNLNKTRFVHTKKNQFNII